MTAIGVDQQAAQGLGHRTRISGVGHHQSGLAVEHGLGRPAAVPGHLGHAGGGRFEEDDAEALLLQTQPAVAAGHDEHVGRSEQGGPVLLADPAEHLHPDRAAAGQASQVVQLPAVAHDGHHELRIGGGQAVRRSNEHVHALARHQAAHAREQRPLSGQSEPVTRGAAFGRLERDDAADVDAGRDFDQRRREVRHDAAGLGRRVAPGRHNQPGVAQHPGRTAREPGSRPGTVISAPWRMTP